MGPGKLVRHMQNPSYTYDEYLICIGLGPSISSVICKNLSYSGPSYPSSPVFPNVECVGSLFKVLLCGTIIILFSVNDLLLLSLVVSGKCHFTTSTDNCCI